MPLPSRVSAAVALGLSVLVGSGDSAMREDTEGSEWNPELSEAIAISLDLRLDDDVVIEAVDWTISGDGLEPISGSSDMRALAATSATVSGASGWPGYLVEVPGIPRGEDYLVDFEVIDDIGEVVCAGDVEFDVRVESSNEVKVMLNCESPRESCDGGACGETNFCAQIVLAAASPLEASIGREIDLLAVGVDVDGDEISYQWSTAIDGSLSDIGTPHTTFTCRAGGEHTVTISVSDDETESCLDEWTVSVTCLEGGVADCPNTPDFPNGVAAGDVDQSSAVLWARAEFEGSVRFEWGRDPLFLEIDGSAEVPVFVANPGGSYLDYIPSKIPITGLSEGTQYYYRACRESCAPVGDLECDSRGGFRTLHGEDHHGLRFGVSSCFDQRDPKLRPFNAIRNVLNRDLDFFVLLGDTAYADDSENPRQFRREYDTGLQEKQANDGVPDNHLARLRAAAGVFATIDDHEVTNDFAGGTLRDNGKFRNEGRLYQDAMEAFADFMPVAEEVYGDSENARTKGRPKLYRYREFGTDAALFLLDQRSFRDEQSRLRPWAESRTMLGARQIADLKRDLRMAENRGITWKLVFIPEPIQHLGPEVAWADGWPGYPEERGEILRFIEDRGISHVVFISGDIHQSIANNLVYRTEKDKPDRFSRAWDISAGPGGHKPLAAGKRSVGGVFSVELPLDDKSPNTQDALITEALNKELFLQGKPLVGLGREVFLENKTPRKQEYKDKPNAKLLRGSYVAAYHTSWTEFDINAITQQLTVTTWGIRWKGGSEEPKIVGKFEVQPNAALVPEPSLLLLQGTALLTIVLLRKRRRVGGG